MFAKERLLSLVLIRADMEQNLVMNLSFPVLPINQTCLSRQYGANFKLRVNM